MDVVEMIASKLGADYRRNEYHCDCPFCGKAHKRGHTHFSFCEKGYKCWVCGASGLIEKLAQHVSIDFVTPVVKTTKQEQKPRQWQKNAQLYLNSFLEVPNRISAWQRYKALTLDSIVQFKLGVGVLPSSRCQHRRLIVPLFENDTIVGFRGRSIDCECSRWLTCGGSKTILYNRDLIETGCSLIICENQIDCILAMQEYDSIAVCSTAGAGTWREEWTQHIIDAKPSEVYICFDNDIAGTPNEEAYIQAVKQLNGKLPHPNGPRLANTLKKAGLTVKLHRWQKGTPLKADLGWLIENNKKGKQVAA